MAATTAKHLPLQKLSGNALCVQSALRLLALSLAATAITTTTASAAEWKFSPSVNVSETYTDNLRLASDNNKESATITQVSPGFSLTTNGPRLDLRADYRMQNLYYSTSNAASNVGLKTNHLLSAGLNARVVENLFFLDGNAQVSQQNLSPFQQQSNSNLNLSGNRTEVRSYSVSPYLRKDFFNTWIGEVRYTHDSVSTDSKAISNSTGDTVKLLASTGNTFSQLKVDAQYTDQTVRYSQFSDLKLKKSLVNASYALTRQFQLTSSVGYEDNDYAYIGAKPSGRLWTAGFNWTPTERSRLSVSAGHRFYGNTYDVSLNQRTRATVWSLSYNDDIVTSRNQFTVPASVSTSETLNQLLKTSVPDEALRQQVVAKYILDNGLPSSLEQSVNTATNRVYLQKSLQASVGIIGARNNILLSLFKTQREALSASGVDALLLGPGNTALFDDTKQTGANVYWNLQLSPRTSTSLGAYYNHATSIKTGIADNNKYVSASIARQLQPKIRASLEVKRAEKDSTVSTNNYTENSILLSLLIGF